MAGNQTTFPKLAWLQTFIAVIDNGCVEAHAAKALGLSASTVNRHIEKLDAWGPSLLFNPNTDSGLTNFGHSFAMTAREILNMLEEARLTEPSL